MISANEWLRSVAAVLGDDEPNRPFQRYPVKDLVHAYNRGMSIVYKYRPDLFTNIEILKLVAGSDQDASQKFENVLDILAQVDENGGVIKNITNTKTKKATVKNKWARPSCLTHVKADNETEFDYVMSTANIDTDLNGRFTVQPPVPCGTDVYVKAKVIAPPCELFEQNVSKAMPNSTFHNTAVWHYVVASMLIGDRHAQGASGEGQMHMSNFFNLLAIEYKQEQTIEKSEG